MIAPVRSAGVFALCLAATSALADPAYDRFRRPDLILQALELAPGMRVADVGAGQGYLSFRLDAAVGPGGRVVATDVDPGALALLAFHAPARSRVEVRLVAAADPGLEAGRYERVLLAQVDHLLGDRPAYLRRLALALAPGGRLVVVNRLTHRAGLLAAAAAAGLRAAREVRDLPGQYLVVLERPASGEPKRRIEAPLERVASQTSDVDSARLSARCAPARRRDAEQP